MDEDRFSDMSLGDVLLLMPPNKSLSLAALIDNGDRATLPGVILGSSSMFFSWEP